MWYVYMLRCNDTSLYTGITTDVEKRIIAHNSSSTWAKYTKAKRPVTLVWSTEVADRSAATKLELHIKKMKKEEKENLCKKN